MNPSPPETRLQAAVSDTGTARPGVCPTCGSARQERFCPSCGQRRMAGRHTLRRFGRETLVRIIGEEGLLHTAVQLTLTPGRVVTDYLAGRTIRYINPVGYLLLTAAAFTVVGRAIGGATGASESDRLWALLVIPFVALASRILHWRGPYNLAEHLIIVTYLGAQVLALLTVLYFGVLLVPSSRAPAYAAAALGAALGFYLWAYTRVFAVRRYLAGLAAALALVLGAAVWLAILVLLVGLLRH